MSVLAILLGVHLPAGGKFTDSKASSSGLVRAIQQFEPLKFDMACTDHDENWTCEPDVKEPNCFHHVRMMTLAGSTSADIILDSGADTSALPLATLMLVNHAVMKQLDRTTLMLKVVSWTLGTPDWPQLTLEMVLFCVSVSSLQT